jgi:hypothetical protein
MTEREQRLRKILIDGSVASLVSTAMLTLCGWLERGRPAGPNNGPSQWVWGERAGYYARASWRHTGVGYVIHHLSSWFWAVCHAEMFERTPRIKSSGRYLSEGLAIAAIAALVDYGLTPRRLRPGFDKHLSLPALTAVYAAFGVGLALPKLWRAARSNSHAARRG